VRIETPPVDAEVVEQVIAFHGHMCPGLAMGIQAARLALREIGPHAQDEEVVAAVETDMCAVDAIQFLTGCTFGKGNLVHRDYGKNAYTFWRRADGKAVRISARPDAWRRDPEHYEMFAKVRLGQATQEDVEAFRERHEARGRALLELDPEELYELREVRDPPPSKARLHGLLVCADCGEATMETRIRHFAGRQLCIECFEEALATGF
jgi:formylmethanofuran dehydrogenase subunit E